MQPFSVRYKSITTTMVVLLIGQKKPNINASIVLHIIFRCYTLF